MKPDAFLVAARDSARAVNHLFPEYAACEAALESNFGNSVLAREDCNLFGMKQHRHAIYGTHNLPTREYVNGEWVTVNAAFVKYPDWKSSFADRMATLTRLASVYPHYANALHAPDGETFVREVSQTWSTDPKRADKVLAIYAANKGAL